jgi:hypothetical protein
MTLNRGSSLSARMLTHGGSAPPNRDRQEAGKRII